VVTLRAATLRAIPLAALASRRVPAVKYPSELRSRTGHRVDRRNRLLAVPKQWRYTP
jgi:hypothetical protein